MPESSEVPRQEPGEQGGFTASWLFPDEEVYRSFDSGDYGKTGQKIAALHKHGGIHTLSSEQLAGRAMELGGLAVDEGDEVVAGTTPFIEVINDKSREINGPSVTEERSVPKLDSDAKSLKILLGALEKKPNAVTEERIKAELDALGKYAKEIGVFGGLQNEINEIQRKLPYLEAAQKIKKLDVSRFKPPAEGLSGWDKRLDGYLEQYRTVAFYNMMRAWIDQKGDPADLLESDKLKDLDKLVDLFNFETPPMLMLYSFAAQQLEMAKRGGQGFEPYVDIPPKEIKAIFREGRYGKKEPAWGDKVDFLSVRKADDRKKWCLANMHVFNRIINSTDGWKRIVDLWVTDLDDSVELASRGLGLAERRELADEVEETKKDILALMAVSSAGRAMDDSGGDPTKYVTDVSQGGDGPNISVQDSWALYILANDSSKLNRLILPIDDAERFPLIAHFYKRTIESAGVTVVREWEGNKPSRFKLGSSDLETLKKNKELPYYLTEKAKMGGFDGFIKAMLADDENEFLAEQRKNGVSEMELWSAAKIATDAFYVDKFTRWVWLLEGAEGEIDPIYPRPDWGGDPFRSVLEPAFLQKIIKGAYPDSFILELLNSAFNPRDIFDRGKYREELRDKAVVASAVNHLKHYFRLQSALANIMGDSLGGGISKWDSKSIEALVKVPGLLHQVYGGISLDAIEKEDGVSESKKEKALREEENKRREHLGSSIVGAMTARGLFAKAQAFAEESGGKGIKEVIARFFESEKTQDPYAEVLQFLMGPNADGKGGFIYSLEGLQLRIALKDNVFDAQIDLDEAINVFRSRTKDPRMRGGLRATDIAKLGAQLVGAAYQSFGGK